MERRASGHKPGIAVDKKRKSFFKTRLGAVASTNRCKVCVVHFTLTHKTSRCLALIDNPTNLGSTNLQPSALSQSNSRDLSTRYQFDSASASKHPSRLRLRLEPINQTETPNRNGSPNWARCQPNRAKYWSAALPHLYRHVDFDSSAVQSISLAATVVGCSFEWF